MRRRDFLKTAASIAALPAVGMRGRAFAAGTGPLDMKIGYHYWAPAGLIFETLKNTNILDAMSVKAEFPIFSTGGPLAEAAVGGSSDTMVGGDVTVLRGTSRRQGSKVVMRSNDWRWAVVARTEFEGKTLSDLKGKKLGGSFVAGSFIGALKTMESAGINPHGQVSLVNLDLPEAVAALQQKIIDAAVIWDPALEKILSQGVGKVLYMSTPAQALGWQALTDRFLDRDGEEGAVRFCKAWITASWWTSNNPDQPTQWFAKTSRLDPAVIKATLSADRYLRSPVADINTLDFRLSDTDIKYAQMIIDFLYEQKLATDRLEVAPLVQMSFMTEAMQEISSGDHMSLSDVNVKA